MSERWLLITVSTSQASSTLRVHCWRRLRRLGAHYLQQSSCLLPDRPDTAREVTRLMSRVKHDGGAGRVLHLTLPNEDEEAEVIGSFSAERTDEYGEVVSRTGQFFEEIELERGRGRATYTEFEESEADLKRLQGWLASIRARDYFDAEGFNEATAAVEACSEALTAFESEALAQELSEPAGAPLERRHLRAVDLERGKAS